MNRKLLMATVISVIVLTAAEIFFFTSLTSELESIHSTFVTPAIAGARHAANIRLLTAELSQTFSSLGGRGTEEEIATAAEADRIVRNRRLFELGQLKKIETYPFSDASEFLGKLEDAIKVDNAFHEATIEALETNATVDTQGMEELHAVIRSKITFLLEKYLDRIEASHFLLRDARISGMRTAYVLSASILALCLLLLFLLRKVTFSPKKRRR